MILYSTNPGSNKPQVQQLNFQNKKVLRKTISIKIYFLPHTTEVTSSETYFSTPKIHLYPFISF